MNKIRSLITRNKKLIIVTGVAVLATAVTTYVVTRHGWTRVTSLVIPDDVIIEMVDGVLTIANPS